MPDHDFMKIIVFINIVAVKKHNSGNQPKNYMAKKPVCGTELGYPLN